MFIYINIIIAVDEMRI